MRVLLLSAAIAISFPAGVSGQTFHGDECTGDCSGHEAGYEWAEENDITDPDECDGDSDSFIEGCQAWAKENAADDEEAIEDGECEDEDKDGYCD